jgi:ParB-like chromosome segregation protein Spo0J
MDDHTQQLDLTAPIPTGNTKAAAAAAGATSADLWMVPYAQLHYDPADNIRPVDPEWVTHLTALIVENGYDKGAPLHCYARKVDGKDLLYVYKGQHRYLAAGKAIEAGKDIGKIPVVVRDAKTVNRAEMVIDGYLSNDSKRSSPLDLAAAVAELRDIHGMTLAQICKRLHVTDQTVRDVGLLERAPAELHQLVRDGQCTGTLAIEQIRQHGGDKALERIVVGISKAAEAGKTKVTKKYLEAASQFDAIPDPAPSPEQAKGTATTTNAAPRTTLPAADVTVEMQAPAPDAPRQGTATKINDARAKQLFQALQSVLHDPGFGKLSPGTIEDVHRSLTGLEDLFDAKPIGPRTYPVDTPNEHGVFPDCESITGPALKRGGLPVAEIRIAQPKAGKWIFSISVHAGTGGYSGLPSIETLSHALPTRGQAIGTAIAAISRLFEDEYRDTKERRVWQKWRDQLLAMPDPDWTDDMSGVTGCAK